MKARRLRAMAVRYCLLVWGVMRREPRETGGGDGVWSAPLVVRLRSPFGVSVILKI